MTALRMRARDIMSEQELIEVRTRSTWKSVALIAHAWTLILGSIAMVAIWPNPFTFILAVAIIGSRQLGLAILMHDGAHGCLAKGENLNLFSANGSAPIRFSPKPRPIAAIICSTTPAPSRTTIPT